MATIEYSGAETCIFRPDAQPLGRGGASSPWVGACGLPPMRLEGNGEEFVKSSHRSPSSEAAGTRHTRTATAEHVSVVVCTRDRAEMLERALEALAEALPDAAEVIVIDSGSTTPQTARTAESFGVRYVRSDIPGLSIARNLGLQASTRDIVIFTDDDCRVAPDFLLPLVRSFSSPRVGAATGHLRDISDVDEGKPSRSPQVLSDVVDGLDAGHGALMAFRRSVITKLGGFDPILGAGRYFGGAEDIDALCRVLGADLHVTRVPDSIVEHVFTRDDDDFVRLNRNYGLGMGAMCAKWWRASRRDGRRIAVRVARRGLVRYFKKIRTARSRRGQASYLTGMLAGVRESQRIPIAGYVYVDESPPAAVSISSSPASPESGSRLRS